MKSFITFLFAFLIIFSDQFSQNCSNTSTGYIPLNDLGTQYWRGKQGGLYPAGNNFIPADHFNAGMIIASQEIKPLDTNGVFDPVNGKIVLLSIGMSNTTQEFSRFIQIANNSGILNPKLRFIDGAQGGQSINVILDTNAAFWNNIITRLRNNGLSRKQVQAIWFKQAESSPSDTSFPGYSLNLKNKFKQVMNIFVNKYPNVKLCFSSSRIYAGYASSQLNPEPYAYYSGWTVKWMIEDQINGDTTLSYTGSNRKSPWLAWGPYLWADGMIPRSDGLIWRCPLDYNTDGTHPSDSGRTKVAYMLFNFFKTDSITKSWFTSNPAGIGNENISQPGFRLYQNFPNPFNPTTSISFTLDSPANVILNIFEVNGKLISILADKRLNTGSYSLKWDAGKLPSGVYYYRLKTERFSQTRKMVLVK